LDFRPAALANWALQPAAQLRSNNAFHSCSHAQMANSPVPRLKDVAKAANVSLAAASRILRGDRERFGEETCRRVLEASRQLGWRRNLLVSGMQTGRTQTIGVMIPPFDSFWVSVLSGIHETLSSSDYLPITVWTGNLDQMPFFEKDEVEGLKMINRLLDRRVDGLIMWPPFSEAYYHHFPEFVERRVPVAVIDHYSTVADSVETDEEQAATVVADHLLRLGHRRIACMSSRETPSQTWAHKRRGSFEVGTTRAPPSRAGSSMRKAVTAWKLRAKSCATTCGRRLSLRSPITKPCASIRRQSSSA
jgi:DNA-binding LacI/PurR family transcriptional regulator